MKQLIIHNENIVYKEVFVRCCPFDALQIKDGIVYADEKCRLCGACVRKAKYNECEIAEVSQQAAGGREIK